MPETTLRNLYAKINKQWRIAFFDTFIIGLLTHLFVMTSVSPNHDGMINNYDKQRKFASGRFFLSPFAGLSSYFELPLINGLLSVLYLSLLSVVLIEIFKLRKTFSIVLLSGLVVTFPTVAATFSYMFTADGYMLSFFTTALAILLTIRYKYGFIPGSIIFFMSVGVYQANLPLAMSIVALWFIKQLLFSNEKLKTQLITLSKQMVMVMLGMIAYVISFKLYQHLRGITGYQGLNNAGNVSLRELPNQLLLIARDIFNFFFGERINFFEILNIGLVALIFIGGIVMLVYRFNEIKFIKSVLIIISAFVLPILPFSLYFISPDVKYHMLMVMSLVVIYFIPLILYDSIHVNHTMANIYSWLTVIILSVIVFNFALISNISYLNMNLKYERAFALANRVLYRIEQIENIDQVEKIAIIGNPNRYIYSSFSSRIVARKVPKMTGALGNSFLNDSDRFSNMLDQYLGADLAASTNDELRDLKELPLVKELDIWPSKDSIIVIDDTVIIKFSEE